MYTNSIVQQAKRETEELSPESDRIRSREENIDEELAKARKEDQDRIQELEKV